jgi:hypothetical protein
MAKGKFALPLYSGGSGGGSFIIREYTSSTVWNKPAGLLEVFVVCIGGGGAGGGAGSSAAGTVRRGGGGGASGYPMNIRLISSQLGNEETVTVGAGGIGGIGTSGATGGNGTAGGNSLFGSHIRANGNNGGSGGGNNIGGNGGTISTTGLIPGTIFPFWIGNANIGANANTTGGNGVNGTLIGLTTSLIPGGAAGAGIPSTNSENSSGGNGGRLVNGLGVYSPSNPTATALGSDGGNGIDNWALQFLHQTIDSYLTIGPGASGGGGKCGDAAGTINGGNGGKGGNHGSGGGGGGAATEPAFGGSGGDGGNGCVIVMEIY